ncbi:MAG: hypothetical protein ACAH83_16275 [Alphaproteobacteria bacterium]
MPHDQEPDLIVSDTVLANLWCKSIACMMVMSSDAGVGCAQDDRPLTGLVVSVSGDRGHFVDGVLHADGGPAFEYANGGKEYFQHGKYHRIGGPAIDRADGTVGYYRNGKPWGPDNGGPTVRDGRGYQSWYLEDKLHREDGPAVTMPDGEKKWYLHGKEWPGGPAETRRLKEAAKTAAHQKMLDDIGAEMNQGLAEPVKPFRPLRLSKGGGEFVGM